MHEEVGRLFQSSPVTKDGRYGLHTQWVTGVKAFQSSPVTKDGRYGFGWRN